MGLSELVVLAELILAIRAAWVILAGQADRVDIPELSSVATPSAEPGNTSGVMSFDHDATCVGQKKQNRAEKKPNSIAGVYHLDAVKARRIHQTIDKKNRDMKVNINY